MAAFSPVNTNLAPQPYDRNGEERSPTTPRPSTAPSLPLPVNRMDEASTPTNPSFEGLANQRPLPSSSPFPAGATPPTHGESSLHRGDSQHSARSQESEDVDMDGSEEGEDGSGDESTNADGSRSKKNRKSQKFYCTDFPPCKLGFTRSEHLARHIRKHTGERPFECHCGRKFSRLDNLRQHAQTVHLNEEIPHDSLAASGTRYQRQIRTDRVRAQGHRSRASTAGSQSGPGPVRGHQRNSLSASSIGSVGSSYSQPSELRRRPPPLVMADPRARRSQEMIYRAESPSSQYHRHTQSPGGFSTPTSATFSTGQNSPRYGSGMQSPILGHSRPSSLYSGHRTPGRRLSVPSGNPFQSPLGSSYGSPSFTQINSSHPGAFSPSGRMISSPTSATSGILPRRDYGNPIFDERRRTWHNETYYFQQSRFQNVVMPPHYAPPSQPLPQPPTVPSNAPPPHQQLTRLPGIESFDPVDPSAPPRRNHTPMMMIDPPSRVRFPEPEYRDERPQWDKSMQNSPHHRLDIAQATPTDTAGSWASEANRAVQAQAEQSQIGHPTVRFEQSAYTPRPGQSSSYHQHTNSAPPITPREAKRRGWYHGPLPTDIYDPRVVVQRTSPGDSSSSEGVPGTPSGSAVVDYNPSIVHPDGYLEPRAANPRQIQPHGANGLTYPTSSVVPSYTYMPVSQHPPPTADQTPKSEEASNLRFEALVAVATNENAAATRAY
ncbi:hypothetical protein B7494_g2823 [Chlorociboria aeruginascens]|nr:hypothetical protein B7494_g2823 [Chlorociboria aeruginascens]